MKKDIIEILSHKSFNIVDALGFGLGVLLCYHGFMFDGIVLFFLGEMLSVHVEGLKDNK